MTPILYIFVINSSYFLIDTDKLYVHKTLKKKKYFRTGMDVPECFLRTRASSSIVLTQSSPCRKGTNNRREVKKQAGTVGTHLSS